MHANVWFTINKLFEFEFEYLPKKWTWKRGRLKGVIIQYDINLIKNLKNALYLIPKIVEQGMIKVDKTVGQFVKDIHVY